eukprot:CAMPEP_0203694654 /NCGR_PEP_ID=MMETSP0091-20130426/6323_1 /ASSEMBLY_ACC=CAM_ASM_001089 /TAXON_ID=426623 /ORGANISM="Chaetoceros affinis, Strain CCMP159" /LENGTH=457 /DNA_ID=CAMNT_0050566051 /DNA_START=60 /DNA_END=1433 /DNA_ORIENTATION=-
MFVPKRKAERKPMIPIKTIIVAATVLTVLHVTTLGNAMEYYFRLSAIATEAKSDASEIVSASVTQVSRPKRYVILLGPHERFNFGDLLFEKVVSKLLMTKLGYEDHEIIRAAPVPRNMTVHGGYEKIVSMKQAQNMSRTSPYGPFDIIYTGGQVMPCKYKPAVNMLGDPELTAIGLADKIYECPYMVPKELLLPLNDEGEPDTTMKNIAITNSVGGFPGRPECKKAVDTADYNVYRDIAPLAPDSAVMVKELYGDLVSSKLEEVRKSLFPGDEDKKYIAVQFKKSFNVHYLSNILDNVARKTGCTIVFFAAGTAPGHDSFDLYKNVTEQMKEPALVYEGEDVWKTVAVISGAEAVFSSSLHVRIMAFIYLKPRVTWCPGPGGKHDNFINLWDAPNMRVCGEVNTTWPILARNWGETPAVSQEETEIYYKKTVSDYMASFEKWGKLLDDSNKIREQIK